MKKESKRWIDFATEDLKIAELALKEGIYNQVCFHSQQCVEKVLKGYLLAKGKIYPKTHKLADLMAVLKAKTFDDLETSILALDRFYIPTRYPDAIPGSLPDGIPTEDDAMEAFNIAEQVLKRAKGELGKI